MSFDWTFNVGHFFTLVGMVGTAMAIYFALRFDVKVASLQLSLLGGRMINVENQLKELTQLTVKMAESNIRMESLDARFDEQHRRLNSFEDYLRRIEDRIREGLRAPPSG